MAVIKVYIKYQYLIFNFLLFDYLRQWKVDKILSLKKIILIKNKFIILCKFYYYIINLLLKLKKIFISLIFYKLNEKGKKKLEKNKKK